MTAGMIRVPSIMPLRPPEVGRKNIITTETPIELHTKTEDTIIYYTINSMKPEPFKQIGIKCTYRYNKPFVLGPGKRVVKAMATSIDGTRESSIVTKAFIVEQTDDELNISQRTTGYDGKIRQKSTDISRCNQDNANKNHRQELSTSNREVSNGVWSSATKQPLTSTPTSNNPYMEGSSYRKPYSQPRFMNKKFDSTKATIAPSDLQSFNGMNGEFEDRKGPENKTHANRLQKDTDFLKCIFCFASRPSDPFARFCAECGSPLPQLPQSRLPPPEIGKLVTCISCHSMVPANTKICIVCESPMPPQWQPQSSKKLLQKTVCVTCGTANPPDLKTCVTCEARLPADAKHVYTDTSAPPVPKGEMGSYMTCSKCSRVNSSDARYCDWCGEKPSPYHTPITCSKCEASNSAFSGFCNSCGCAIEPPPRVTHKMKSSLIGMLVEKDNIHGMTGRGSHASWLPVTTSNYYADKADKATSTVGMFYPSSQSIHSQIENELSERARMEGSRDRRLSLAAVSPGRGYWRQQMDHICAHLKAHSQNNPEFRSLVGEPRLGKIITATVHEDLVGEEFTLTVTFARRDSKENWKDKSKALAEGLKALNMLSATSSKEDLSGSKTSLQSTQKKMRTKKNKKKTNFKENGKDSKLKEEDRLLIKEVGPKGQGREEEIERLLDAGGNPNCESTDGIPLLVLATINKHLDCITTLVNAGSNVNAKTQSKGNTALHEAVSLGGDGTKCIDALLGLGAKTNVKNDAGQTPYDLAMSSGHEAIAERFTSNVGDELLQKLTKPYKTKYIDE